MAISDGIPALSQLGVTFGGFSPTAMSGVESTREQIERVEEDQRLKKEAARKRRQLEMARASKPRSFQQDELTTWTYVVVDEASVRIVGCETCSASLLIPSEIEGLPVYAIGPDACARLDTVEEIVCPDSVEAIGSCAFRLCPQLKKVRFPRNLAEFNGLWLQRCPSLEEMALPGKLDVLKSDIFENPDLKHLHIGTSVHVLEPGAFRKSRLESVSIDEDNPFIKTDGAGIYSSDGTLFVALAARPERYVVAESCERIAKKAFSNAQNLKEVVLPDSVAHLEAFSFAHAGIARFEAPAKLESIAEKAFYYCKDLESIRLNDGLEAIGDSAFEESGLLALDIPASIEAIGSSITAKTPIVHAGPACSIRIDEASPSLFLDGEGGLYKRCEDGIHLVQLIDREAQGYSVLNGATFIDERAFAYHDQIRSVSVPEGVVEIGANAFRFCTLLERVELPDSVRTIGEDAFLDTALVAFRVPASLEELGKRALVMRGAHHGDEASSLRDVEVAPGNATFYLHDGMLCRRNARGEGADSVVLFNNSCEEVAFPKSIVAIEDFAFNNACGIRRLSLNKRLKTIGQAGLLTWCWIELIQVELEEPLEGRTFFEFRFPDTFKGIHGISIGLGGASWVNVPGLMAQYDISLVSAHDYNAPRNQGGFGIYEQVERIIERLGDPIMLTSYNKEMYRRLLRNHIVEICVDVSRHDDRALIDALVELECINADNIEEIVLAVGKLQDAAMTGYLLELKRRRFGRAAFDFDL